MNLLKVKNEFLGEQLGAKSNVNPAKLDIKADFHLEIKTVPRLFIPRVSTNRAFQF